MNDLTHNIYNLELHHTIVYLNEYLLLVFF